MSITIPAERAELERLARHSNTFPTSNAFAEVLRLTALPRIEAAERFDRLAGLLTVGTIAANRGEIEQLLDELLGTARFHVGEEVTAELGGCPSCGGRSLVFVSPCPDWPLTHGRFRCDRVDQHVSGPITFAADWSAVGR